MNRLTTICLGKAGRSGDGVIRDLFKLSGLLNSRPESRGNDFGCIAIRVRRVGGMRLLRLNRRQECRITRCLFLSLHVAEEDPIGKGNDDGSHNLRLSHGKGGMNGEGLGAIGRRRERRLAIARFPVSQGVSHGRNAVLGLLPEKNQP